MSHEKMIIRNKDMYRELDLFIERIESKDNYIVCKNELEMLKNVSSGVLTNIVVFKMLAGEVNFHFNPDTKTFSEI